MNALSKRIRKFKKTQKNQTYENSDDPQEFSACIANLNQIVSEEQFKQIVTRDLLSRLLDYLKHVNPQVVINSLNALQNVLRISDNFGPQTRNQLKELGLIGILINFNLQNHFLASYLSLIIEIFETWEIDVLSSLYQKILPLIQDCITNVYSEDIIFEVLNLLQVLTEIPQYNVKQLDLSSIFQHKIITSLDFANQMKLKSLTLQSYLNIGKLDQDMLNLINEIIRINIFQELDNIELFLSKQNKMEEETEFKQDERLLATLSIWRCSAHSIIQALVYLNRIYEQDQDDKYMNKNYEQFFNKNVINELEELTMKNFYNFNNLIQKKLFTDQTTFSDELLGLSILIFNLGNNLLTSLQPILCFQSIEPILLQIQTTITTEILQDEDKKELTQSYILLLIQVIKYNQGLIIQIPELFPNQLCESTDSNEILFHIVELMKIRYSYKQKNSIDTIRLVTQQLLKLMSQSNIMLAAQALDCLFDVYTEEDYNQILVEMNILDLLKQGHQYLQQQLPQEKKKLEKEDWKFLKLAVQNLKQFIEYKQNIIR